MAVRVGVRAKESKGAKLRWSHSDRPMKCSMHMNCVRWGRGGIVPKFPVRWVGTLIAQALDALNIRVVLAPDELGPYNRHAGGDCLKSRDVQLGILSVTGFIRMGCSMHVVLQKS
jgi:hypothetical protein